MNWAANSLFFWDFLKYSFVGSIIIRDGFVILVNKTNCFSYLISGESFDCQQYSIRFSELNFLEIFVIMYLPVLILSFSHLLMEKNIIFFGFNEVFNGNMDKNALSIGIGFQYYYFISLFVLVSLVYKNIWNHKVTLIPYNSLKEALKPKFISVFCFYVLSVLFFCYHIRLNNLKHLKMKESTPLDMFNVLFNGKTYVWGVQFGCQSETIIQGRSYEDVNIEISFCSFSRALTFSGDGGVISISIDNKSMSVSNSMFYKCSCLGYGGAIFFSSSNSSIKMICANSCSCGDSSSCHFAFGCSTHLNQVEYLSISNCSHSISGSYPIRLEGGDQRVDNMNSSLNKAYQGSGITIVSPKSFSSSHCTFSCNKVSHSICLYFILNSFSMLSANIIQNDSPINGVIFVEGGAPKMNHCIYQNNQNTLFCVWSGSLEILNSFIDHLPPLSFSSSTQVSTSCNNSFTKTTTYEIHYFKSIFCNAEFPYIGKTPEITIDQSPMRSTILRTYLNTESVTNEKTACQTIVETQKETNHRSYAECICTQQILMKKKISVIFSFSFINPTIILFLT